MAARTELIVRLRDHDCLPWAAVAELAGVSETTAIYHYQQEQTKDPTHFAAVDVVGAVADEAFVMVLGYCGPRVTDVCDFTVADVDVRHAKFRIPDPKTRAGVREVDMTSRVVEVVAAYFDGLDDLAPDAPAFPRRQRQLAKPITDRTMSEEVINLLGRETINLDDYSTLTERPLRRACSS